MKPCPDPRYWLLPLDDGAVMVCLECSIWNDVLMYAREDREAFEEHTQEHRDASTKARLESAEWPEGHEI